METGAAELGPSSPSVQTTDLCLMPGEGGLAKLSAESATWGKGYLERCGVSILGAVPFAGSKGSFARAARDWLRV